MINPTTEPTTIILNMKPMACPRPRAVGFAGHARAYMPESYRKWKERAKLFIRQQYKGPKLDMPLHIIVTVVYQRPVRLMRKKDPAERILKTTKPDLDNVLKSVLDALEQAGVMENDSQVVGIMAWKFYGKKISDKKSERNSIKIDIYPL